MEGFSHASANDPQMSPYRTVATRGISDILCEKQVSVTHRARNSAKTTRLFNGSIFYTVLRVWKETDESRKSRKNKLI